MERQNRFDEAVKASIGAIEADPSARVWANVRSEVGIGPAVGQHWGYKVAAAVAVLFLVGIGYTMNHGAEATAKASKFAGRIKQPRIFVAPLDYNGKAGIYLAKNDPTNLQYRPDADIISWNAYNQKGQSLAEDSQQQKEDLDLEKFAPEMEAEKQITHHLPKRDPKELRPGPDKGVNEIVKSWHNGMPPAKSFADAGSKHTYRVPSPSEIKLEDIKRKSGAFLGAVTAKASDLLGMDASYEEKNEENLKTTAFSADFGLFKIKKVKTVR